jgi:alkylhydroperoxidase family enzyme
VAEAIEAIEELRASAAVATAPRPELSPYLDKVRARAYTVTDGDVAELKRAGISEDEIFEATVAVAVSEGLRRLDAALRVIG